MTSQFDKLYESLFENIVTYVDEDGNVCYDVEDENEIYDGDEEVIDEKITKRKVIRKGKKVIKYKTNKEGYKVVIKDGKPKEVRLKPAEKRRRKIASRKSQRKMKGKRAAMARQRKRSLRKRKSIGSTKERPV
jgi:hypothetical protein